MIKSLNDTVKNNKYVGKQKIMLSVFDKAIDAAIKENDLNMLDLIARIVGYFAAGT